MLENWPQKLLLPTMLWYLSKISPISWARAFSIANRDFSKSANLSDCTKWVATPAFSTSLPFSLNPLRAK